VNSPESEASPGLTLRRTSSRLRKPSWRIARTSEEADADKSGSNGSPSRPKKLSPSTAAGKMAETVKTAVHIKKIPSAAASPARSEVSASGSGGENHRSERVLRKRVQNTNTETPSEDTRKVPKLVVNLRANNVLLDPEMRKSEEKSNSQSKEKIFKSKSDRCLCEVTESMRFKMAGTDNEEESDGENSGKSFCKVF